MEIDMDVEEVVSDDEYDEESEDEDDNIYLRNGRVDEKHHAADFIANCRTKCQATREGVRHAIKDCEKLLIARTRRLLVCVNEFLQETNMAYHPAAQRLLQNFDVESPFKGWKGNVGQVKAVQSYYDYLVPRTAFLGQRVDRINVGNNEFRQMPVRETFQYVSIKDILKMVARRQSLMQYIRNQRPRQDGWLCSFTDGDNFAESEFFQRYPDAFQLGLYYDGVETASPLGSKTGSHNIAYFACKILNLPPYLNSLFGGYHPIAIAHTQDVEKYGFRPVLQNFIDECLELESPQGVEVYVHEQPVVQRACVCALLGDTKAVHEILGLLSPSARHFCRICMISRQQLNDGVVIAEPRSRALHDLHLEENALNADNSINNGVREQSCLHDLQTFFLGPRTCLDSMHDIAEGVAAFEIKLALREFVCHRRYFNAYDLNRRIKAYDFGSVDRCNKPTANFNAAGLRAASTNHNLTQTSSQIFCLLRFLPLLLDNLGVPHDDNHLHLLRILQQIVQIVRAPKVHRALMPYLQNLIESHRMLYRDLYPNESIINKHHHLEHYVASILSMGPLEQYNCMRAEASMRPFKRHVVSCNSYRNVTKTAAEYIQIAQAVRWGNSHPHVIPKFEPKSKKNPTMVFNCRSAAILTERGFQNEDIVQQLKTVSVYGREYKINTFVVLRSRQHNNGIESFGRIVGIIVANNNQDIWLEIEEWVTENEEERFNAFVVREPRGPIVHLLDPLDLPNHAPISPSRDYSTDNVYLVLRHVV